MTSFPWQLSGDSIVSPGRALPSVIGPSTLELVGSDSEEGSARLHRSLCSTEVLADNR